MPYTLNAIGACNCAGPCSQTFTVNACSGQPYASVPTVNVFNHSGGTLLASGTVNGSGQVTLTWTGSTGSYFITVTGASSRFASFSSTTSLTCGGSHIINLSAASGFVCGLGCLLPIATTLHVTFSTGTTCVLTYVAGGSPTWQNLSFPTGGGGTASMVWDNYQTGGQYLLGLVELATCYSGQPTYACPTSFTASISYTMITGCTQLGTGATITE
jgi:hypothetical protein